MEVEINVSIDYEKFKKDGQWDGLRGCLTNGQLTWQIEKAFRISKTDLRIRPIYHYLPGRISTHLVIAFASYKLYKELERN